MLITAILFIMKIYDIILTCSLGQDCLHVNTYIMNGICWLKIPIKYSVFTHLIILLFNNQLYTAYYVKELGTGDIKINEAQFCLWTSEEDKHRFQPLQLSQQVIIKAIISWGVHFSYLLAPNWMSWTPVM